MLELFRAGGPVMVPLLACSVITVAVIVERGWYWWRVGSGREGIVARVLAAGGAGDTAAAAASAETAVETVARMRLEAEREASRLGRYLGLLSTMVSLAPMLGIFGTVLGIMDSFQLLDASAAAAPMAAKQGLAKALLTTAFGLLIAMLSLIALKFFQGRVIAQREAIERACSERELTLARRSERS